MTTTTATEVDIEDVMDMEVHVDLHRLRDLARLGVPARLRGRVYKYLLGVCSADKSGEVTNQRQQEKLFRELMRQSQSSHTATWLDIAPFKSIRAERGDFLTPDETERLEGVLRALSVTWICDSALFSNDSSEGARGRSASQQVLSEGILSCAWTLNKVLREPQEVYDCVCTILRQNPYRSPRRLQNSCAIFTMLLHELMPKLGQFFGRNPALSIGRWLPLWLSGLLANQLHPADTLRLWDNYVAEILLDSLGLHLYVCLSILDYLRETLLSGNALETTAHTLERLPCLPIDSIIMHARSLREEVQARALL